MQTCQVCGKQNPRGVEYCEDCGASLTPQAGGSAGAAAAAAPAAGPGGTTPPAVEQAPMGPGGAAPTTGPMPQTAPAPAGATGAPPAASAPAEAAPQPAAASAPVETVPQPTSAPASPQPGAPATGATTPAPAAPAGSGTATPAGPAGVRARLAVKRFGAPTGEEFPLAGERLVVGRFDPETGPVDVDLSAAPESEQISRQHGELYREGKGQGQWFVRDLGSTNGVFVRGRNDSSFGPRITAPRALSSGDELAFGNARFVFLDE